jgi:hypothetical protein
MVLAVLQIMYLLFFFAMVLMSIFIVYHIVFYSYTFFSKIITLCIFVPVVGILLFTNFALFRQIPLADLVSNFLQ